MLTTCLILRYLQERRLACTITIPAMGIQKAIPERYQRSCPRESDATVPGTLTVNFTVALPLLSNATELLLREHVAFDVCTEQLMLTGLRKPFSKDKVTVEVVLWPAEI